MRASEPGGSGHATQVTPRLQTDRLFLRAFRPRDWEAMDAMLSDLTNTRWMHFSKWTGDNRREWFESCLANATRADADALNWAITLRRVEAAIGWFAIDASDDGQVGERSFGYLLDQPWWNWGYMTEALEAVLAFEFGTLGTPRIHATCETANPASARVHGEGRDASRRDYCDADFEGNWPSVTITRSPGPNMCNSSRAVAEVQPTADSHDDLA